MTTFDELAEARRELQAQRERHAETNLRWASDIARVTAERDEAREALLTRGETPTARAIREADARERGALMRDLTEQRDTARARLEVVERAVERIRDQVRSTRFGADMRYVENALTEALAGSGAGEGEFEREIREIAASTGDPTAVVFAEKFLSAGRPTPPERGAETWHDAMAQGAHLTRSAPTPPPGGQDEPGELDHLSDEDCRKELEAVWSALGGHLDRVNVHPSGETDECTVAECVAAVVRELDEQSKGAGASGATREPPGVSQPPSQAGSPHPSSDPVDGEALAMRVYNASYYRPFETRSDAEDLAEEVRTLAASHAALEERAAAAEFQRDAFDETTASMYAQLTAAEARVTELERSLDSGPLTGPMLIEQLRRRIAELEAELRAQDEAEEMILLLGPLHHGQLMLHTAYWEKYGRVHDEIATRKGRPAAQRRAREREDAP